MWDDNTFKFQTRTPPEVLGSKPQSIPAIPTGCSSDPGWLAGTCGQSTHSHDTFVHEKLIKARTAQMFHSPREHAWLKANTAQVVCLGVSKVVCQSSVMSHMLPHLSQSTSTRSLTCLPTIFLLPHCPVLQNWIKKRCEIHDGVADTLNLHLQKIMSPS